MKLRLVLIVVFFLLGACVSAVYREIQQNGVTAIAVIFLIPTILLLILIVVFIRYIRLPIAKAMIDGNTIPLRYTTDKKTPTPDIDTHQVKETLFNVNGIWWTAVMLCAQGNLYGIGLGMRSNYSQSQGVIEVAGERFDVIWHVVPITTDTGHPGAIYMCMHFERRGDVEYFLHAKLNRFNNGVPSRHDLEVRQEILEAVMPLSPIPV